MTTAQTKQELDDLLAGPIGRETLAEIMAAIYTSYSAVDTAHGRVRDMVEGLNAEGGEADREQRERAGLLLFALGEYEQAIEILHDVQTRKTAAHVIGRAYLKLRREELAVSFLEKGRQNDDDLESDMLMAEAYCAMRDGEAVAKLAARFPEDSADGRYVRGLAAETAGEYADAMAHYEAAIEIDDRHAPGLFRLALACDLNGDDERAVGLYKRCADLDYTYVGALINLGILYEDTGDYEQAVECYRRVLAIAPRNEIAQLYLKDAESSLNMYLDTRHVRRVRRAEETLKLPISGFELSPRSRTCLERMNVKTLGGLTRLTRDQLLSEKNFGDTSLTQIEALLFRYDLSLRDGPGEGGLHMDDLDEDEGEEDTPEISLDELDLSTRSRKCMDRLGIRTVGELIQRSEKDLLAVPNFGGTSLNEITTKLSALGLSLKSD